MERPHIIGNDNDILDMFVTELPQGLQGLGLAGAGITKKKKSRLPAAFEDNFDQCPVKREIPLFQNLDIVQGEDHFLEIAEISEFVPVGDSAHEHVIGRIIIKNRREIPEMVQLVIRNAEGVYRIRLVLKVFVFRQLKQVAKRKSQLKEFLLEINKDNQLPDLCRIT